MGVADHDLCRCPGEGPGLAAARGPGVLVLLFSCMVSGQIKLRRIDGWRKIAPRAGLQNGLRIDSVGWSNFPRPTRWRKAKSRG